MKQKVEPGRAGQNVKVFRARFALAIVLGFF
jgi:hypothetical protein